jgi:hypothetical protein
MAGPYICVKYRRKIHWQGGSSVTNEVSPGTGYIFFKRKQNPAIARTKEVITINESSTYEFVFTDNTLIVEANNPDNTGTLNDMTLKTWQLP